MKNRIFSTDSPKAVKADAFGYLNAIHYMSPADTAGVGNLCPKASEGCKTICLGLTSGQAGMVKDIADNTDQGNSVRKSRREKSIRFMRDRAAYMRDVVRSIELAERKAAKLRKKLCVRMNGSTDIAWEGIPCLRHGSKYRNLMDAFPRVQFVDYTKIAARFKRPLPANYHLTFSRSETNWPECFDVLSMGFNVAAVYSAELKEHALKHAHIVDGDEHDLRHLDPKAAKGKRGYIVALSPKGRAAKKDTSGFVVRFPMQRGISRRKETK